MTEFGLEVGPIPGEGDDEDDGGEWFAVVESEEIPQFVGAVLAAVSTADREATIRAAAVPDDLLRAALMALAWWTSDGDGAATDAAEALAAAGLGPHRRKRLHAMNSRAREALRMLSEEAKGE
jgi:hypothetical protein